VEYEEWKDAWNALLDKCNDGGYENLGPEEKMWIDVRDLIDATNNGGLISYYYNSGADHLDGLMDDLRTLKAHKVIDIMDKMNALFPEGRPSPTIDDRNEVIDSWDGNEWVEERLEGLEDEFTEVVDELEAMLDPVIERVMAQNRKR
jgi:hypothetical protein